MEACRILVVDDNQNIHRDFRRIIELAGAGISLLVLERLKRPGLRFVPKPWSGSQILAVIHELRARARGLDRHSTPSR